MTYSEGMSETNGGMGETPVASVHVNTGWHATDGRHHAAYGLAAEIRAVGEGHNARVLPDGSVLVKANSQPGSYHVSIRGVADGVLRFGCTCRSGVYREVLPVPCKHAALAGRRLERESLARWEDGSWRLRERAQVRGARLLLARTVQRRPRAAAAPLAGDRPQTAAA